MPEAHGSKHTHRIGAVSAMSGVPVPTLRVWESRYAAFQPQVTPGGHRQYADEDVLRATLLRRLTELGHAISSVANHETDRLNNLLLQHGGSRQAKAGGQQAGQGVKVAVVGLSLATQLNSAKFQQGFLPHRLQVVEIWPDLHAALEATVKEQPQVLLVQVRSLQALVQTALQRLIQKTGALQVMVSYHFGQEQVAQSLRQSGVLLRRGPISAHELPDLFRSAMVLASPAAETGFPVASGIIGPRRFDDATLARMAAISTSVLCECPRHVSEIITQLVSFEQYSDECLSKSPEDFQLHAYLHSVAGSARALFEAALERVAIHEGIDLDSTGAAALLK